MQKVFPVANKLRKNWTLLWNHLSLKGNSSKVFSHLSSLYNNPLRYYHNLNHIDHCLTEFSFVKNLAVNPDAIEMAIYFHDAVYDTHSKLNEETSADLTRKILLEAGANQNLITKVSNLILVTKHAQQVNDQNSKIIIDVDLSIFGQNRTIFDEYETGIRLEYSWFPEKEFNEKRVTILKSFLNRPKIYSTELFISKYEGLARKNLTYSIEKLSTKKLDK